MSKEGSEIYSEPNFTSMKLANKAVYNPGFFLLVGRENVICLQF